MRIGNVASIAFLSEADVNNPTVPESFLYKGLSLCSHVEQMAPYMVSYEDLKNFSMIVVSGVRAKTKPLIDKLSETKPVIVFDLGWINREFSYQLCLGGLNKPVFKSKNLSNFIKNERDRDHSPKFHVIFGQKPMDGQHLLSQVELIIVYTKLVDHIVRSGVDRNLIRFRPHPKETRFTVLPGVETIDTTSNNFLDTLRVTKVAYTYNSTSCVQFMIEKVPFVVLDKSSMYYPMQNASVLDQTTFLNNLLENEYNKEKLENPETYKKLYDYYFLPKETLAAEDSKPNRYSTSDIKAILSKPEIDEVPVKELEQIEIRMNNEKAQKWYDSNKHLKFMQLKKKVKDLTGVAPANGPDVINVLNSYFSSI